MNVVARSCGPWFSPQGHWAQVPAGQVQAELRLVFSQWGRPQRFRVDNGVPWGSWGDFPTDLALWLLGLQVEMIWNPPRQPQQNGVVERSQGTAKRWAEPKTCTSVRELQQRLDEMDRIQREVYPSIKNQSRIEAFPTVLQVHRPYDRAWERQHWDMDLVLAHLKEYTVTRRVDRKGQVSIYNRNHYVGEKYRGRDIYVFLDPFDLEWVFSTVEGLQVRRRAAEEISQAHILNLTVTHRR
jgi:hypothetical protein